ncbi:MAG: response regulator transcription factor [Deltaproteobacteria bacterium]|nr:response regulator transcription factor [Deltaproteobacteria bacterium]
MRVLLVEDDNLIGTMVRLNLEQDGYAVDWQRSGEAALQTLRGGRFDCLLLDIGLPGISGIDVAKQARKLGVGTPILMLTARDETDSKVQALDYGADDYLCKPFEMKELLARVRAHIRRSQGSLEVPTDQELRIGLATVNMERRALTTHDGLIQELSDKEAVLLALLHKNPGRALSRADILEEVWGMDATPTERTVDNFIVRLRRWVEPEPDRPRHIITVRGWGYRYEP